MAVTTYYSIDLMVENQANGFALFNAAMATLDGAAHSQGKGRHLITLSTGGTPSAGAQAGQFVVPLGMGGASATWTVKRIFFRVAVAGGAPQITVEKYTGTGAFAATTVGTVTLGSGAYEGSQTSAFTTSTLTSGDKVRLNVNALGTATGWVAHIELQEA